MKVILSILLLYPFILSNAQTSQEQRIKDQKANTYLTINNGGHISLIRAMAITRDGKTIITAGEDKVIYIRNAQTGEIIDAIYGNIGNDNEGSIYTLALSPDNKYLAVGGCLASNTNNNLGAIRLYDFQNRKFIGLLHDISSHTSATQGLAFTEDSKYLVSGTGSTIRIWDVEQQSLFKKFTDQHGVDIVSISTAKNKIVSTAQDTKVILWDFNSDTFIKEDTTHEAYFNRAVFSPDGSIIASSGLFDKQLIIYDNNLNVLQTIKLDYRPGDIAFSPDGKKIIIGCDELNEISTLIQCGTDGKWTRVAYYDGLKLTATLAVGFIDNSTVALAGGENYEVVLLKIQNDLKTHLVSLKETKRFSGKGKPIYSVGYKDHVIFYSNTYTKDSSMISLSNSFDLFKKKLDRKNSLTSGIEKNTSQLGEYSIKAITYNKPGTYFLPVANNTLVVLKNGYEINRIIKESYEGLYHNSFTLTNNNFIISTGANGNILAYRMDGTIASRLVGHRDLVNDIVLSADGKYLFTCSSDQTIKIWSTEHLGEKKYDLPAPIDVIEPAFNVYYEKRNLVEESKSKNVYAWKRIIDDMHSLGFEDYADFFQKTLDYFSAGPVYPIASLYIGTDNEWILWSDDGYFTSSKHGGKYIGYHINQGYNKEAKFYPFEQFDLKFNRPDIMLQRLGSTDSMLIAANYKAYKKRLKKMGLTENDLSEDLHLPEIVLQSHSQETTSRNIEVEFDAKDEFYKLDRLNIHINDIPIYGSRGLSIKDQKSQLIHEKLPVILTKGKNKIQISVFNEKGVESMKETYYVTCNDPAPVQKDRYVVVIGVSDYNDSDYDLTYAAKDAKDLATLFELKKGDFTNVKVLRILDKSATRENILKSKQFLMQSKVDDQVVLFAAGHGLLDNQLDWYFATADIDFNNPAARGVAYSDLEGLLDSIPARSKLMLMDACHSGEVDKEGSQLVASTTNQGARGVKSRGFKTHVEKKSMDLQSSFQLMQELFADLSNGTGTTVISSASGAEYAYESETWNNGVFTYALIDGLKSIKADLNKDKKVNVSELKDYVTSKVSELTKGKQNPTSRKENLEYDFRVW